MKTKHAPKNPTVAPENPPDNSMPSQDDNAITSQEDDNGNGLLFHHFPNPKKRAFLATFATNGQVVKSAGIVGIDWSSHYYWLAHDPEYVEAYKLANVIYADALEAECSRRGMEGIEEPVFQAGREVGVVRKYSDLLLIFRTKGALPGKYADRVTINIEDQVRQIAQEMGVNPDEAVLEAQKLLGPGKNR